MTVRIIEEYDIGGVNLYRKLPDSPPGELNIIEYETGIWLISRLIVPKIYRKHGIANELLQSATAWADNNGFKLILQIDPYEDCSMDSAGLQILYRKYGFVKTTKAASVEPVFIRYPQLQQ